MTRLHLAPSHLLSELDAFAILLSFAKTTCYTLTIFLSFQNWAPPQSAYWLGYRKTIISSPPPSIWQYLVSVHPSMSASRLKIEWSTPSRCISLLPEATPFNPTIMFGTTLEKMVFLWSAFWAPLEHVDKQFSLLRLMYSPLILLTRNPPFLLSKNSFVEIFYFPLSTLQRYKN